MKQDDTEPQSPGEYWAGEIKRSEEHFENWRKAGKKIVARFRDERSSSQGNERRFNILWSNIQVLIPALYGRKPQPEVQRRYKDQDPIGRTASTILQRCLEYEVNEYTDFDNAMACSVEDRLLPGRGTAWMRFESEIVQDPSISEDVESTGEHLDYECAPCDYVYWQDFNHSVSRTWEEVWWVSRAVYMTKEEGEKRFGELFVSVPINSYEQDSVKEDKGKRVKKARVHEIWDKTDKKVRWIADGYDQMLDESEDFLNLQGFFPCPKPLFATTTTSSLVPVPDYREYQDQAEEIDSLTRRISMLTKALKVVGVFNGEFKEIQRILNEATDNQMISVDSWAAFAEKGGMKGAMEFIPIEQVAVVLKGLYEAREQAKQSVYEIMGISDIIRGSSNANETLGAQQLKANFGSLRLKADQEAVAVYATDLLRKKAQIICSLFKPETIIEMSGVKYTMNMETEGEVVAQAIQLLKSELKSFRISIEADTLAQLDENKEKADRMEFLRSTGEFLQQSLPVMQQSPKAGELLGELLLFGIRGFKVGATIERSFEEMIEKLGQQPQVPPEVQQQMQQLQAQLQQVGQENQQLKVDQSTKQMEMQFSLKERQANNQVDMQIKQQEERLKAQAEQQRIEREAFSQKMKDDAEQRRRDGELAHAQAMAALEEQSRQLEIKSQAQKASLSFETDRLKDQQELSKKVVDINTGANDKVTKISEKLVSANEKIEKAYKESTSINKQVAQTTSDLVATLTSKIESIDKNKKLDVDKVIKQLDKPRTIVRDKHGVMTGIK